MTHVVRHLFLVRHGETDWNREGRYQGQTDIPLNERGRAEALALRERLGPHGHLFDPRETAILSSDLLRARETAELAFGLEKRQIALDAALREFRFGVFEGLTREEIDQRYPDAMGDWVHGDDAFVVPGGESRNAVQGRARAAVLAFLAKVDAPNVVVVSHGGVLRQLVRTCFPEGKEPWRLRYHNTATHVIVARGEAWTYKDEL